MKKIDVQIIKHCLKEILNKLRIEIRYWNYIGRHIETLWYCLHPKNMQFSHSTESMQTIAFLSRPRQYILTFVQILPAIFWFHSSIFFYIFIQKYKITFTLKSKYSHVILDIFTMSDIWLSQCDNSDSLAPNVIQDGRHGAAPSSPLPYPPLTTLHVSIATKNACKMSVEQREGKW